MYECMHTHVVYSVVFTCSCNERGDMMSIFSQRVYMVSTDRSIYGGGGGGGGGW